MLKMLLKAGLIATGLVSLQAHALYISDTDAGALNGADVGSIDTFLEVRTGVNGDAAELAFINDYAEPDLSFSVTDLKIGNVVYWDTDTTNVVAFGEYELGDFFIVKNSTYSALYANNAESNWGVLDLSLLPDMNLRLDCTSGCTISHVSRSPSTTTVPEPGMLGLLAIGLLGVAGVRRFKV